MVHSLSPIERTWSVRAAWQTMGVSDRACRRVVSQGYIPRKNLRGEHLIALRVATAIEHFPAAPDATPSELKEERTRAACRAAQECWFQGDEDWLLVVTALEARVARDHIVARALIDSYKAAPTLLIPIGKWCSDLRQAASIP